MDFDKYYSERALCMRASEIRELLKVSQQPEIISFAGGLPSPNSFPLSIVKNIIADIFVNDGDRALSGLWQGRGIRDGRDRARGWRVSGF